MGCPTYTLFSGGFPPCPRGCWLRGSYCWIRLVQLLILWVLFCLKGFTSWRCNPSQAPFSGQRTHLDNNEPPSPWQAKVNGGAQEPFSRAASGSRSSRRAQPPTGDFLSNWAAAPFTQPDTIHSALIVWGPLISAARPGQAPEGRVTPLHSFTATATCPANNNLKIIHCFCPDQLWRTPNPICVARKLIQCNLFIYSTNMTLYS